MGERLNIGEMDKKTEEEHLARYRYASQFTKGASVIDAACGSGYGSLLLAENGAREVIGVDISEDAIATAKRKYLLPSGKFVALDVEKLSQLGKGIADVVVSFETIEHVSDDAKFLDAVYDVLKEGGTFFVSTPELRCGGVKERLTRIPVNRFHRREYTRDEFVALIGERFKIERNPGPKSNPEDIDLSPGGGRCPGGLEAHVYGGDQPV